MVRSYHDVTLQCASQRSLILTISRWISPAADSAHRLMNMQVDKIEQALIPKLNDAGHTGNYYGRTESEPGCLQDDYSTK